MWKKHFAKIVTSFVTVFFIKNDIMFMFTLYLQKTHYFKSI